ncbi:MAG: hypothetical protein JW384_01298 [Nitrosomonadaceae bacterium]|nr:hypothetical protein [Nitrosomonadaceae bacterium]
MVRIRKVLPVEPLHRSSASYVPTVSQVFTLMLRRWDSDVDNHTAMIRANRFPVNAMINTTVVDHYTHVWSEPRQNVVDNPGEHNTPNRVRPVR